MEEAWFKMETFCRAMVPPDKLEKCRQAGSCLPVGFTPRQGCLPTVALLLAKSIDHLIPLFMEVVKVPFKKSQQFLLFVMTCSILSSPKRYFLSPDVNLPAPLYFRPF